MRGAEELLQRLALLRDARRWPLDELLRAAALLRAHGGETLEELKGPPRGDPRSPQIHFRRY